MRYMILINTDESSKTTDSDRQQIHAAYSKYTQELKNAGVMLAGDALHPSSKGGARIKVANGKRTVTDGPFTEAKELVGGYYLIQVKSRDEALEWAARCPGAQYDGVEVREVIDMTNM